MEPFLADISRRIWEAKYRATVAGQPERSILDSWRRISTALAAAESHDRADWESRFFELLRGFRFLPGGRIQAGAGTGRAVTLFNCFVMGAVEDSIPGIFRALEEAALTMQQGGGVGYDFSTLRPKGTEARAVGAIASGPVSFMRIWDAMCDTILSTGARRGAMMGVLRCDHPDIEAFVEAKRTPGELRRFNLSVAVTDDFMRAVRADAEWPLVFPAEGLDGDSETVLRLWPGRKAPVPCRILARLRARALWDRMAQAAYDCAEPGVLFLDRINRMNNLGYCERISATNPCGEVPLPAYGACDLGSFNLAAFVRAPFTPQAWFDFEAMRGLVPAAVRLLDDAIDCSRYPLPEQEATAKRSRRIGLGITGLADALVMLGRRYDSEAGRRAAADIVMGLRDEAYRASARLAAEKGPFPAFDRIAYLGAPFVRRLPAEVRAEISRHGVRNSHLLAIAPAGTISLLAGNVSSGLEPIFAGDYSRRMIGAAGQAQSVGVTDYALALWRERCAEGEPVPPAFVTADEIAPKAHLEMQAALQPFVDNSISKTVNAPASCSLEEFRGLFETAYDLGLKGCTAFRPNPVTGAVLEAAPAEAPPCCSLEREPD